MSTIELVAVCGPIIGLILGGVAVHVMQDRNEAKARESYMEQARRQQAVIDDLLDRIQSESTGAYIQRSAARARLPKPGEPPHLVPQPEDSRPPWQVRPPHGCAGMESDDAPDEDGYIRFWNDFETRRFHVSMWPKTG